MTKFIYYLDDQKIGTELERSRKVRLITLVLEEAFSTIDRINDSEDKAIYKITYLLTLASQAKQTNNHALLSKISTEAVRTLRTLDSQPGNYPTLRESLQKQQVLFVEYLMSFDGVAALGLVLARAATAEEAQKIFLQAISPKTDGYHSYRFFSYSALDSELVLMSFKKVIGYFVEYGKSETVEVIIKKSRLSLISQLAAYRSLAGELKKRNFHSQATEIWKKSLERVKELYLKQEQYITMGEYLSEFKKYQEVDLIRNVSEELQYLFETSVEPRHRIRGAIRLAEVLEQQGRSERAIELFSVAYREIAQLTQPDDIAELLLEIAKASAQLKRFDLVRQSWETVGRVVGQPGFRDFESLISKEFMESLDAIPGAAWDSQLISSAILAIQSFKDSNISSSLYLRLTKVLVDGSKNAPKNIPMILTAVRAAVFAIRSIPDERLHDDLLDGALSKLIEQNSFDEATVLNNEIHSEARRTHIFLLLSKELAKKNRITQSIERLNQALQSSERIGSSKEVRAEISETIHEIAEHATDPQEVYSLNKIVNQIYSQEVRYHFLSGIARGLKDTRLQKEYWNQAIQATGRMADQSSQSAAYAEIAAALAKGHAYPKAREIANLCIFSHDRLHAYTEILREYLKK